LEFWVLRHLTECPRRELTPGPPDFQWRRGCRAVCCRTRHATKG
jgi:hypothetical protein